MLNNIRAQEEEDRFQNGSFIPDNSNTQQKYQMNPATPEEIALNIGCTFNVAGFRKFKQPHFNCKTCSANTDTYVIICEAC